MIENEDDENTPLPLNNIIDIKPFIISTNDKLTFTEKRLYNIEGSINHITEIDFPKINAKIDTILHTQRQTNKYLLELSAKKSNSKTVWFVATALMIIFGLASYILATR